MNVDLNKIITKEEFDKEWVECEQFAIDIPYRVKRPRLYELVKDPDPTDSLEELIENYDYTLCKEEDILKYFRGLCDFNYIIGAFDLIGNGSIVFMRIW